MPSTIYIKDKDIANNINSGITDVFLLLVAMQSDGVVCFPIAILPRQAGRCLLIATPRHFLTTKRIIDDENKIC